MLAILAVVVVIVGGPLRRAAVHGPPGAGDTEDGYSAEVAELEASREAKYREIRDADLDHRTGKLSDADYEAVDRGLRAEAMEILRALDRVRGPGEGAVPGESAVPGEGAVAGEGAEPGAGDVGGPDADRENRSRGELPSGPDGHDS